MIFAGVGTLVIVGIANYLTHIQTTPITGRKRYIAFTSEQFNKIADFEFEMVSLQLVRRLNLR